jgi:phosphoglycerate dehydrogenase-like enzyme
MGGRSEPVVVFTGPEDAVVPVQRVLGNSSTVVRVAATKEALGAALSDAWALVDASMKVRIDADMIARAPSLRVVSTATTGADHIDANALQARGVPLLTLAGQRDLLKELTPAAEHSWLLLMACARRLRGAINHVLVGDWERTAFPGLMLKGRVLGLVGCGRIGSWMAGYAAAFGMRVIAFDPHATDWPANVSSVLLDELVTQADFISIHVPLNASTTRLFGRGQFLAVKSGAILINTSRGEVIDEGALLDALNTGRLAGAGLDVLQGEPEIRDHPLRQYALAHDNLIITPHIGGFSPDAVRVAVTFAAERVLPYLP